MTVSALPDGWELVSRHGNYSWLNWLTSMLLAGGADPDSITLTVRETATTTVRKVTADNEAAAIEKIRQGSFD